MGDGCLVDNCCFCIDLKVGTLILGYLSLVGSFIYAILVGIGIAGGSVLIAKGDEDQQMVGGIVLAVAIIMLIVLLVNLLFTIVLLVGVHKDKRGHVKAYLIFNMICIVLMIIGFFGSFAGPIDWSKIIQNLITIVLSIYYWVVIRSYWVKMGETSKNRPAYTA
ncbi:hypothetical protein K1T71_008456 [Dendrolimus kikuchii]|uniref:Uncharacterized protein n=1 Tax=Dendrolimus kikuchii TaxID=765133 RepID=A0ACC1CXF9_9NEOP|nr:hypothetical protein K1T71_008456 [Dendrolimus kikuchii]